MIVKGVAFLFFFFAIWQLFSQVVSERSFFAYTASSCPFALFEIILNKPAHNFILFQFIIILDATAVLE